MRLEHVVCVVHVACEQGARRGVIRRVFGHAAAIIACDFRAVVRTIDGDGHLLLCAVCRFHREGFSQRGRVHVQRVDRLVAVIQHVGPLAVRIHTERAVLARRIGLRLEHVVCVVHVACEQGARRGVIRRVFGHAAAIIACDFRAVVRTIDGDGHLLLCAVCRFHREGFSQRGRVHVQRVDRLVAVIQHVGPLAVRIHTERAVLARRIGLRLEHVVCVVHVACEQGARRGVIRRVFGHAAAIIACDFRAVVRTIDGDGHLLLCAVCRFHREGFSQRGRVHVQRVDRLVAVIQHVGPLAVRIHTERAVLARRIGLRLEHVVCVVHVACEQGARRGVIRRVFGHAAAIIACDFRAVVRTIDGDGHLLLCAVCRFHREGFSQRGRVHVQRVDRLVAVIQHVGPLAVRIHTERAVLARRIGLRLEHVVCVVHVACEQGARRGVIRRVFGHAAAIIACDFRAVVRTIDGDGHLLLCAVCRFHREGFSQRGRVHVQRVDRLVAVIQHVGPLAVRIHTERAVLARRIGLRLEHVVCVVHVACEQGARRGVIRRVFGHAAAIIACDFRAVVRTIDGDGHLLLCAVCRFHREGFSQRGRVHVQRVDRLVAVIQHVGPLAVRIHTERAVLARRIGLRLEHVVCVVHVACEQGARRGVIRRVFGHAAAIIACDFRAVVRTIDGDGHLLLCAVCRFHREGFSQRGRVHVQRVDRLVAVIQHVGPLAVRIHTERAVLARRIGLRLEHVVCVVHVACEQGARRGVIRRVFGHAAAIIACDFRAVVRTIDGDGHLLLCAVCRFHREGFSQRGRVHVQRVDRLVAVIQHVGPLAVRIHTERAVLARRIGLRLEHVVCVVHVACEQGARRGVIRRVFGHAAAIIACDFRAVVRTIDGDGHLLLCAVCRFHREGFSQRGRVHVQRVDRLVAVIQHVGPLAVRIHTERAVLARRIGLRLEHVVCVVHVACEQGARRGVIRRVFGHAAAIIACDFRAVVRTIDGDGHLLLCAVCRFHREGFSQRGRVHVQRVDRLVAVIQHVGPLAVRIHTERAVLARRIGLRLEHVVCVVHVACEQGARRGVIRRVFGHAAAIIACDFRAVVRTIDGDGHLLLCAVCRFHREGFSQRGRVHVQRVDRLVAVIQHVGPLAVRIHTERAVLARRIGLRLEHVVCVVHVACEQGARRGVIRRVFGHAAAIIACDFRAVVRTIDGDGHLLLCAVCRFHREGFSQRGRVHVQRVDRLVAVIQHVGPLAVRIHTERAVLARRIGLRLEHVVCVVHVACEQGARRGVIRRVFGHAAAIIACDFRAVVRTIDGDGHLLLCAVCRFHREGFSQRGRVHVQRVDRLVAVIQHVGPLAVRIHTERAVLARRIGLRLEHVVCVVHVACEQGARRGVIRRVFGHAAAIIACDFRAVVRTIDGDGHLLLCAVCRFHREGFSQRGRVHVQRVDRLVAVIQHVGPLAVRIHTERAVLARRIGLRLEHVVCVVHVACEQGARRGVIRRVFGHAAAIIACDFRAVVRTIDGDGHLLLCAVCRFHREGFSQRGRVHVQRVDRLVAVIQHVGPLAVRIHTERAVLARRIGLRLEHVVCVVHVACEQGARRGVIRRVFGHAAAIIACDFRAVVRTIDGDGHLLLCAVCRFHREGFSQRGRVHVQRVDRLVAVIQHVGPLAVRIHTERAVLARRIGLRLEHVVCVVHVACEQGARRGVIRRVFGHAAAIIACDFRAVVRTIDGDGHLLLCAVCRFHREGFSQRGRVHVQRVDRLVAVIQHVGPLAVRIHTERAVLARRIGLRLEHVVCVVHVACEQGARRGVIRRVFGHAAAIIACDFRAVVRTIDGDGHLLLCAVCRFHREGFSQRGRVHVQRVDRLVAVIQHVGPLAVRIHTERAVLARRIGLRLEHVVCVVHVACEQGARRGVIRRVFGHAAAIIACDFRAVVRTIDGDGHLLLCAVCRFHREGFSQRVESTFNASTVSLLLSST